MHMGNELKEQLTIASSQLSSFELMSDSKITIRGHTFNFYDYVNEFSKFDSSEHYPSIYISPRRYDKVVDSVRPFVPPVLWQALRKLMGRP